MSKIFIQKIYRLPDKSFILGRTAPKAILAPADLAGRSYRACLPNFWATFPSKYQPSFPVPSLERYGIAFTIQLSPVKLHFIYSSVALLLAYYSVRVSKLFFKSELARHRRKEPLSTLFPL